MLDTKRTARRLIIYTTLFFVVLIGIGLFVKSQQYLPAIFLDTQGQPTIGASGAKVHLVIFEEPKCRTCKEFHIKIFPEIKKEYIDTNKVLYTVIPISFLPSSLLAAEALMCVYYQGPNHPNAELFFTFLGYMYQHQPPESKDWATDDQLIEMAHLASPEIQLRKLRLCIDQQTYRGQVAKNTEYARRIMKGNIAAPVLYINGVEVKELSYKKITKMIQRALEKGS